MTIDKLFNRSDKDIKIYVNYRRKDIRLWWDKQFIFTSGPMAREFLNILDIQHGFCTLGRKRKIKKKIPQVLILPAASGGGVAYIIKRDIRLRISWDWNVNNIDVSRCLVENF